MKDLTFPPTSMTTGYVLDMTLNSVIIIDIFLLNMVWLCVFSCGYLAVGGQRSQLMVRQLSSNWYFYFSFFPFEFKDFTYWLAFHYFRYAHTSVGGSINNALCISSHPTGTRLLVCNNDESIKVYSLPALQRIANISLPTAVNYGKFTAILLIVSRNDPELTLLALDFCSRRQSRRT